MKEDPRRWDRKKGGGLRARWEHLSSSLLVPLSQFGSQTGSCCLLLSRQFPVKPVVTWPACRVSHGFSNSCLQDLVHTLLP